MLILSLVGIQMAIKNVFVNCHISSEIIRNRHDFVQSNFSTSTFRLSKTYINRGYIHLTYFAYVKDSVTEDICYFIF